MADENRQIGVPNRLKVQGKVMRRHKIFKIFWIFMRFGCQFGCILAVFWQFTWFLLLFSDYLKLPLALRGLLLVLFWSCLSVLRVSGKFGVGIYMERGTR